MKEDKKFCALDLELNQPSGKIIEVGITIGSLEQPACDYLTKSWLIDPGEPINPDITTLTGIDDQAIGTRSFTHAVVAEELGALLRVHNCFVNPITWGAGDSQLLLSEFRDRGVNFPFFGRRWVDVKTFYVFLRLARGHSTSGGLSSAMGSFKLPFQGKAHRADVDAFNTLRFFFHLLQRQSDMETIVTMIAKI